MSIYKREARRRAPTHPGEILKEDIIPATKLSITEVAARLHVSRQSLYDILNGSAGITPNMAVKLGALFGNSPEFWLNMQQAYDIWYAKDELKGTLKEIEAVRCPV